MILQLLVELLPAGIENLKSRQKQDFLLGRSFVGRSVDGLLDGLANTGFRGIEGIFGIRDRETRPAHPVADVVVEFHRDGHKDRAFRRDRRFKLERGGMVESKLRIDRPAGGIWVGVDCG